MEEREKWKGETVVRFWVGVLCVLSLSYLEKTNFLIDIEIDNMLEYLL